MAGNSDSAKRGNKTRAEQAERRDQDKRGTGAPPPVPGTGRWARERGIWKDGDTEGPAPKTDPKTT